MSTQETIRELETLLAKKRRAGVILLDMEGYERWGAARDTEENRQRMFARGAQAQEERQSAIEALTALVAHVRASDPDIIERWVELHRELLQRFIDGEDASSTGRSVATDEREAWSQVARGELPFVDENVYYVHLDREAYVAAFGVDL